MERNQRLLNRYALDEEDTIYVLELSYGKDSLACLGAIEKLGLPLHRIVHKEVWATQDIPADLPPMVEFKAKADEIIYQRYGIKVEHICATKNGDRRSYEDVFYQERKTHKNGGQFQRYGFPMQKGNWCTSLLKTDVKVSKDISKKQVSYLGIAADEPIRIKRHEGKKELMLPLVEIGWDEDYCGLWCKYNDLLSPIYTASSRGGCWFCHNQGVEQLRLLRKRYPNL